MGEEVQDEPQSKEATKGVAAAPSGSGIEEAVGKCDVDETNQPNKEGADKSNENKEDKMGVDAESKRSPPREETAEVLSKLAYSRAECKSAPPREDRQGDHKDSPEKTAPPTKEVSDDPLADLFAPDDKKAVDAMKEDRHESGRAKSFSRSRSRSDHRGRSPSLGRDRSASRGGDRSQSRRRSRSADGKGGKRKSRSPGRLIDDFIAENKLDEKCAEVLRSLPPDKGRQVVLDGFHVGHCKNPSAVVMSRVRKVSGPPKGSGKSTMPLARGRSRSRSRRGGRRDRDRDRHRARSRRRDRRKKRSGDRDRKRRRCGGGDRKRRRDEKGRGRRGGGDKRRKREEPQDSRSYSMDDYSDDYSG